MPFGKRKIMVAGGENPGVVPNSGVATVGFFSLLD